jgi:hypothetical protein
MIVLAAGYLNHIPHVLCLSIKPLTVVTGRISKGLCLKATKELFRTAPGQEKRSQRSFGRSNGQSNDEGLLSHISTI